MRVLRLQVINQFDKEFQEQSDDIIFQTILAANFLDIKNLLELMCKKVADEIKKCKTPDDIRDRCNAVSALHSVVVCLCTLAASPWAACHLPVFCTFS
jgi:hypothetical protein